jgi:hypothetical protein
MTGMSECRDSEPSRSRVDCGLGFVPVEGKGPNMEVGGMKKLSAKMAAAVVVALSVVALVVGGRLGTRYVPRDASRQGLMPEVVVRAEKPGIVMPTVEVRAFRTLAMSASSMNVN